jgi:hypothetical protein
MGSPGGGGGAGGACGAARLFRTMSSNSAMSFALLPCCLSSLLIRWRHSAASGSNSVENIRLLMSNSWSSQSFLAMGRALRVDARPTSDTPTHRSVVAGRERLDRPRARHSGHHRRPGRCASKGGSTLCVRRDHRDIEISQDEEKPLKPVGVIRFTWKCSNRICAGDMHRAMPTNDTEGVNRAPLVDPLFRRSPGMSALPFGRPAAVRVMNYISPRALCRTGGVSAARIALWVPIWLPNRLSSP